MKSLKYSIFGDPLKVLKVENVDIPEPRGNEVRIKMILSPIHNHDVWTVKGLYGHKPSLPATGGSEAVGYIDAFGSAISKSKSKLKIGDRVAVSSFPGAWSEYFVAAENDILTIPEDIDNESAAQLLSMPFSAITLLDFLSLKEGDWVIQNASNGAVGKAFYFLAKSQGVNVVNLVRRNSAEKELSGLNIKNVICTQSDGWENEAMSLTGEQGFAVAIDSIGGKVGGELLSLLSDGGALISFGTASAEPLEVSAGDLIFKQAQVKGFWALKVKQNMDSDKKHTLYERLIEELRKGNLLLPIERIYSLDDIGEAFDPKKHKGSGKILLRP